MSKRLRNRNVIPNKHQSLVVVDGYVQEYEKGIIQSLINRVGDKLAEVNGSDNPKHLTVNLFKLEDGFTFKYETPDSYMIVQKIKCHLDNFISITYKSKAFGDTESYFMMDTISDFDQEDLMKEFKDIYFSLDFGEFLKACMRYVGKKIFDEKKES